MGPSEVVIVAGEDADPEWIAADLLAQAEHDPRAAALPRDDFAPAGEARRGGGRRAASGARDRGDGARRAARLRRGAAGRRPRGRGGARRGDRARAPAAGRARDRGGGGALPQRRRGLRRRAHPRRSSATMSRPRATSCRPAARRRFASGLSVESFRRRTAPHRGPRRRRSRASRRQRRFWPKPKGCRRTRLLLAARRGGMSRFVRAEVRALRAYTLDLSPCRFKLDQNEVPWELPRRIKEEVARRLVDREWARYPDFHAARLRERLAAAHGWMPDGGAGRQRLERASGRDDGRGRRSRAGDPRPRAELRALPGLRARSRARGYRAVGPRADLALPTDELEREIDRDPRRPVLVASPNNPTGEAIRRRRSRAGRRSSPPRDAPLLLDNAYGEFCRSRLPAAPRPASEPGALPHLLQGLVARRPPPRLSARRAGAGERDRQGEAALQPRRRPAPSPASWRSTTPRSSSAASACSSRGARSGARCSRRARTRSSIPKRNFLLIRTKSRRACW